MSHDHAASPGGEGPGDPSTSFDDPAFLARLKSRDEDAFERLVDATSGRMFAVARRIMGADDDAMDAVQEAYLSAFRALSRFDSDAKVSTWLHRIVVNACLMRLRARRRRPEVRIDDMLPRFGDDGHRAVAGVARDWSDTALEAASRSETRETVRQLINELPDNHRTVLVLRDIEELDTQETAEALGITSAAVKTRLHRARQALRELFEQRFGSRPGGASGSVG